MSALKSVIITLPKGFTKAAGVIPSNELTRTLPKLNLTASIFSENVKMETKKIPKHEDVQDERALFKPDVCLRGKKRRLDHLTWEEKLQRKKLKNRVAAQTSRDRKKAKLDELEDTVRTLREKNDLLSQECTLLRTQNDTLASEMKRLRRERDTKSGEQFCSMCQARVGCTVPSLGSAAGWDSATGTVTDTNTRSCNTSEDPDSLPPLEELFSDLQEDDYIDKLEELAESLLREVTAEVETNSHRTNEQMSVKENTTDKSDDTKRMVGQASENVEADRTARSISNYQRTWQQQQQQRQQRQPACNNTSTAPCVITSPPTPVTIKSEVEVKQEPDTNDLDTVYGTYDETTNCITIIYPGEENNMGIQECVQEVSSDGTCQNDNPSYLTPNHCYSNQFSPAYTCMSPSSIHSEDADTGFTTKYDTSLSDGGYESHDSPNMEIHNVNTSNNNNSNTALTDLWHESFTELFPTLA